MKTSALPYFVKLDESDTTTSFFSRVKDIDGIEFQGVFSGTRTAMLMADHVSDEYEAIFPGDDVPDSILGIY